MSTRESGVDRHNHDQTIAALGNADGSSRSVLVLLDHESRDADAVEFIVGQLFADEHAATTWDGIIVTPSTQTAAVLEHRWRTIEVPDIARVAAAFGVMTLPTALIAGSAEDTRARIEAIVRRQGPGDMRRASGALSSSDLL